MELPFKFYDGMKASLSTKEERLEIYQMANNLKLVPAFYGGSNLYKLEYGGFLFMDDGFWCNNVGYEEEINHIPYEQFKQILTDYEKSLKK